MILAQIVLYDGFDPLDSMIPYEVLATGAALTEGRLAVEFVSAEGARAVPSGFTSVTLQAQAALDPSSADIIVVPGAAGDLPDGVDADPAPGTIEAHLRNAAASPLAALIGAALDAGRTTVATVCGGSMVLAKAGLITGRVATTNHFGPGLRMLADAGVRAINARIVDDGNLITASGPSSGLDLGLYLLEEKLSPRVAALAAQLLDHERRGTVWKTAAETLPAPWAEAVAGTVLA